MSALNVSKDVLDQVAPQIAERLSSDIGGGKPVEKLQKFVIAMLNNKRDKKTVITNMNPLLGPDTAELFANWLWDTLGPLQEGAAPAAAAAAAPAPAEAAPAEGDSSNDPLLGKNVENNLVAQASEYGSLLDNQALDHEDEDTRKRVTLAAACVVDAWEGELEEVDESEIWLKRIVTQWSGVTSMLMVTYCFVLCAFETPMWCFAKDNCGDDDITLKWGWPVLPELAGLILEVSLIVYFLCEEYLQTVILDFSQWKRDKYKLAYVIVLCFALLDAAMSFFIADGLTPGALRLCVILRPIAFCLKYPKIRGVFIAIFETVPAVLDITLIVVFVLFWFSIFFLVLFKENDDPYFTSVGGSMMSLFTCMTTANYPDVGIPELNINRNYGFLFVFFAMVSVWFLMNIFLAAVTAGYAHPVEDADAIKHRNRETSLRHAYQALDVEKKGYVNMWLVRMVIRELNTYDEVPRVTDREMNLLCSKLDSDNSQTVNLETFCTLVRSLKDLFKNRVNSGSCVDYLWTCHIPFENFKCLRSSMHSNMFEHFINFMIVINAVIIMGDIGSLANNSSGLNIHVEFGFTCFFFLEELVSLLVTGMPVHWLSIGNRFNSVFATSTFCMELYIVIAGHHRAALMRYVLVIRLLRLFRVVLRIERLKVIVRTIMTVIPLFSFLTTALLIFCTIYAQIGIAAFGGMLHKDAMCLDGSPLADVNYGQSAYYGLNFNDYISAMNVLFVLLIVNNWFELMDGVVCVAGQASRSYFLIFYFFGVLIFLNVWVGFILDSYVTEKEFVETLCQKEEDSDQAKRSKLFGGRKDKSD